MAEPTGKGSTGAGSKRPRPASPAKEPEAEAAPAPTPESIGIEGVVRVGGHHLDDERGWVPDSDEE